MTPPKLTKPLSQTRFIRWFEALTNADVTTAGGKTASLGEMVTALRPKGIGVQDGFAITAELKGSVNI